MIEGVLILYHTLIILTIHVLSHEEYAFEMFWSWCYVDRLFVCVFFFYFFFFFNGYFERRTMFGITDSMYEERCSLNMLPVEG